MKLPKPTDVARIVVYNRADGCFERLVGARVKTLNADGEVLQELGVLTQERRQELRIGYGGGGQLHVRGAGTAFVNGVYSAAGTDKNGRTLYKQDGGRGLYVRAAPWKQFYYITDSPSSHAKSVLYYTTEEGSLTALAPGQAPPANGWRVYSDKMGSGMAPAMETGSRDVGRME